MKMNSFARTGLALAIAAVLGAATPALAQSAAQSAVGKWLYDANGEIVGSVQSVRDDGRTAIVQYGTILTPGNHLVAIPAEDVSMVGGRATLSTMTADALRSHPAVN